MVQMTGRQGRRCKQLLDDLKERRGYWKLKEEHYSARELALEEAMDLSPDRLRNEWMTCDVCRECNYESVIFHFTATADEGAYHVGTSKIGYAY
jgi:hypothetical protein